MSDVWRDNVERGNWRLPACPQCGLVGPWARFERGPHECNPTHMQMRKIGQEAVERVGRAICAAFAALATATQAVEGEK